MGTFKMKRFVLVCALSIFVMAYAVTEVQELGNDDAAATLDAENAMEHADENEDDDLGEDEDQGRRGGAFLSTTGSFTLSSGGGGGSNRAGNGLEDDEDELGEDEDQG